MAWDDDKSSGDRVTSDDYDTRTSLIKFASSNAYGVSSNYTGHSSNSNIHFTQANITTVGTIGTGVWEGTAINATYIGSHSNTQHDDNYYYQESDLTAVLNDNYPGSSNVNRNYLDNVSSNALTAYDWVNASSNRYEDILASGTQYTDIHSSGNKYTSSYDWMINSGAQYTNIYESGTKYSNAYDWYTASSSIISDNVASGNEYSAAYASANALKEMAFQNAVITTPASGETLTYKADNSRWENELPPMTFNLANVEISANHNINLTRFDAQEKNVYIWQAAVCNSGGASISGLSIELLSGSTSVYKTSSAIIQQGYPLAKSDGGNTEIRFMYSGGATLSAISEYGTAFMQVSVY